MNQLRPLPFVTKRPSEVTERSERRPRGHGTLVARSPTEKGEKFVVKGMQDHYAVEICAEPTCSCTDAFIPCKHMLSVYFDVLELDESNPLTWQPCLLPSELTEMGLQPNVLPPTPQVLPSVTPAKRIMIDLTSSESSSPKRPRATGPRVKLTTAGLDDAAVRQVILFAVDEHPEVRSVLEKHRPTVFEGLSAEASRKALLEIAGKHEHVLQEIGAARQRSNAQVQSFSINLTRIKKLLHGLNWLGQSEARSRIYDFLDPAEAEIRAITAKLNRFSNPASMHNALAVFSRVGEKEFSNAVEKAMEENRGVLGVLESSAVSVLELMHGAEKAKAIKGLASLRHALRDSPVYTLDSHIYDWEANPK